jgi:hypothetical protein
MSIFLISLALLFQTGDAVYSCNKINTGLYREWNPVLGDTCKSIITRKSLLITTGYLVLPKKFRNTFSVGLMVSGGLGITLSIKLNGN